MTEKFEVENYLHADAIKAIYDIDVDTIQNDVPILLGIAHSDKNGLFIQVFLTAKHRKTLKIVRFLGCYC